MVLRRNRNLEEDEIRETQGGFHPGKATREGIFNRHTICERYNDVQKDALHNLFTEIIFRERKHRRNEHKPYKIKAVKQVVFFI